ncbi:serine hydrolase [Streptomyces scabiei]|uniref:serine hydrolase domain-containing protein n=1 Tax=Streptomyces scabiei TaxID=1930 RepID=UPI001B302D88|nr:MULTISPECIES: serine hydrolase domain-containing protein [Streptomyces]MBP5868587.1 beta-lactamase family protein [Streptomyces sp. LBUM 1485]MBP5915490.1 beta-lactamase family protein [Streptomyces sp. LBUM 1486]MDX3034300.1 serine hydrolase [Streptomyces scabiei]MDX3212923.1 serine hydrolase [Streptomyces scabiei]QTU55174.1 beta-lactamase family protein [Streptomyces sp. LBUM 1480]
MRITHLAGTALGTTLLLLTAVPAASAVPAAGSTAGSKAPGAGRLDRAELRGTLAAIHEAGMYGTYSSVRDGRERWTGAAGLADVDTGRKVTPGMRHRVGSISKTFTAVAVMQQVERGRIRLDAPVTRYVPELFRGTGTDANARERGDAITVRMLLNHTSHIGDYVLGAFPSLKQNSTSSLDENRFRSISPRELVRLGLAADATGTPGAQPGSYSNTNYVLAGLILEKVTGQKASAYITRHVIDRAGLHHTSFPRTPHIKGPHARMYESFYGLIDPPRDYSVYDMSWASTAGAIISTTDDLNRFYRELLTGGLVGRASLAEMRRTVPVLVGPESTIDYGLGIYALDLPGCGRFWGHDGGVFGAGTISFTGADGKRQLSLGYNLMKYQRLNEEGTELEPSPIDEALIIHLVKGLCPSLDTGPGSGAALKSGIAAADVRRLLPDGLPDVGLSTGTGPLAPNRPVAPKP